MIQLDTENADRDLTSLVTVLTDTPDASNPILCQSYIAFGDGSKDLDGTGGNFEVTITVGGQTIEPDPNIYTFSTATRTGIWTESFPVPANNEVVIKVKSPNSGDTDVDVTAYLYQLDAVDVISWNSVKLSTTNPLPNAAADAAGGLPISDAGGLDLDTKLANTNEVTSERMGALTDWVDGGRLDELLDAIKDVTDNLPNSGALTDLISNVDSILDDTADMQPKIGTLSDLNGSGASIAGNLSDIYDAIPTTSEIWATIVHGTGANEVTALEALAECHSYGALAASRNVVTGAISYQDPDGSTVFSLTPDTSGRIRS